jgi:hypothetical protein
MQHAQPNFAYKLVVCASSPTPYGPRQTIEMLVQVCHTAQGLSDCSVKVTHYGTAIVPRVRMSAVIVC